MRLRAKHNVYVAPRLLRSTICVGLFYSNFIFPSLSTVLLSAGPSVLMSTKRGVLHTTQDSIMTRFNKLAHLAHPEHHTTRASSWRKHVQSCRTKKKTKPGLTIVFVVRFMFQRARERTI